MIPDIGSDLVKPVTKDCHDKEVLPLIKTKSFVKLNIDWKIYNKCTKDQAKALTAKSTVKSFLDRDRDLEKYVGVITHPAFSIENQTYRGNYADANNVFKAICSTMTERPPVCSTVSLVDEFRPYMFSDNNLAKTIETQVAVRKQYERVEDYDSKL